MDIEHDMVPIHMTTSSYSGSTVIALLPQGFSTVIGTVLEVIARENLEPL